MKTSRSTLRHAAFVVARDALLWCGPRSWGRSLVYTALVAALVLPFVVPKLAGDFPLANDNHLKTSLDLATSNWMCGANGLYSPNYSLAAYLSRHPSEIGRRIRTLVLLQAGSVENYCASLTVPILNNENSLGVLFRAGLGLTRGGSFRAVSRVLLVVKLGMMLSAIFAALACGASLWLVAGALALACFVQQDLSTHVYAMYPFLPLIPLLLAAVYSLAVRFRTALPTRRAVATAMLAGFLTAFAAQMRTSYLPVLIAFFVAYLIVVTREAGRSDRRRIVLVSVLAFGLLYATYGRIFVRPLQSTAAGNNYSYHAVFHPVVLSLALPPNPLAAHEGIAWDDSVGLTLARRMAPAVDYLDRNYDRALLAFYARLWILYPREMLSLYRSKGTLAGPNMLTEVRVLPHARLYRAMLPSPGRVTSGWTFLAGYALLCAGGIVWGLWRRSPGAFLLTLLSLAAVLLHIESILIYPYFTLTYHSYLLWFCLTLDLILIQAILNLGWSVGAATWKRRQARPPVTSVPR